MEWIVAKLGIGAVKWTVGGIAGLGAAWVLKRIPNGKIKAKTGLIGYSAGVAMTLGLSKWKWTKSFWNKIIEPWFVDLLDNVVSHTLQEFLRGLRSDN
jgi:hypothetical protein